LEKAEEIRQGKHISKYNKLFLRGNNILYIMPKGAKKVPKELSKEKDAPKNVNITQHNEEKDNKLPNAS
jgi:hypothetical protein